MPRPDRSRPASRGARLLVALLGAAALAAAPRVARAQEEAGRTGEAQDLLIRGLDLEQAGKHREAAALYRRALGTPNAVSAMLGLERVYMEVGWSDSVLAVVDSVIRASPKNPTYRSIQLRTLRGAGREAQAREAFERWTRDVPRDVSPYREYARLLLQDGRAAQADTVLQRAEQALGTARGLATETAQLRAAMGLWEASARSWREAVAEQDYLFQAAAFSLQPAPEPERARIRRTLMAPPIEPGARRIAAALELAWGNPREAWLALRELTPDQAALGAWRDFAELAEGTEAWMAAAEAFAALYARDHSQPELAARAADAALRGGDPEAALEVTRYALPRTDSARAARLLLGAHVGALTALGQAAEAERVVAAYGGYTGAGGAELARAIAWGWVRAGDPARARRALAAAGMEGDEEIGGWLALYEGDVATARARLRQGDAPAAADQLLALAFVVRTRADRAPTAGKAFLALARGDSALAATTLVAAAKETPDAAPLLLGAAARVEAARGAADAALALWARLVGEFASSPEAAEADLEWGRLLRRRGDTAGAVARFEHLILTYPQSALVPQARRELDLARRAG